MMRVTVSGATGTIGRALVGALRARGDDVVALARDPASAERRLGPGVEIHAWPRPSEQPPPRSAIAGSDAVVHLLGEPISQRWSAAVKRTIRDSRILSTRRLVAELGQLDDADRPSVLVSQSATGYYGPHGSERLDEGADAGADFLAEVTAAWEHEARKADGTQGVRVVTTRTGVVLSSHGGALEKMLPPFKLGVGGPIAGGRQYVPWIHLDDVVGAIGHCLDDERIRGAVNVTAPEPATNKELSRALGRALRRPAVLPVPALALRLLYGEMAGIVLTGQRAIPSRLLSHGYRFRHPDLDAALRDVLA